VFGALFAMHLTSLAKSWTSKTGTKNRPAVRSPRNIGRIPRKILHRRSPRCGITSRPPLLRRSRHRCLPSRSAHSFSSPTPFLLWKNRPYSPPQMRLFLWGWNIAAVLGIFGTPPTILAGGAIRDIAASPTPLYITAIANLHRKRYKPSAL